MQSYAVLVVIDAPDDESAWSAVSEATQRSRFADEVAFIGDPWPERATVDDDGFDTPGCFAQRVAHAA
jgi:hypothetical protein